MSTLALQSHVFSFSTSYLKWASLDLPSGSWLAVYIDSVPNGLHTRLRPYTSLSELERHLPFQLIQASSHERTINRTVFPSTLDDSCSPRRDVGVTGETSEGWLASTEPQTPQRPKSSHGPRA